jgi:hypothetical protein
MQLPDRYRKCAYRWICPTTRRSLSAKFAIDTELAESIEARFGIPAHMQVGGGRVAIRSHADYAELSARGITLYNGVLSVDYSGIAAQSMSTLLPLAQHLIAQAGAGADLRAKVAAVLGLAQAVRYEIPQDAPDGTSKLSFRTPLALLSRGGGDCDSKVCLAAAMLKSVGLASVAIVLGRHHAMLGVELPTQSGDAAIALEGRSYVVTEATTPVPIGFCGAEEVTHGAAFRGRAI